MTIDEIARAVLAWTPPKRHDHVRSVAETIRELAARFGLDSGRAELAGWIHDCSKSLPPRELIAFAGRDGQPISAYERAYPMALHGRASAVRAAQELGVSDPDVLRAVAGHVAPGPDTNALGRALCVADYIEPSRHDIPMLGEIRALARRDLENAYFCVLRCKLSYCLESGWVIPERMVQSWNMIADKAGGAGAAFNTTREGNGL